MSESAMQFSAASILTIFVGCSCSQTGSTPSLGESDGKAANTSPHDTEMPAEESQNLGESSIKFDYSKNRKEMDVQVWALEKNAQQYEQYFVKLWDRIRSARDKNAVLEDLSFREIALTPAIGAAKLEHNILSFQFGSDLKRLDPSGWKRLAEQLRSSGYRLLETEWHHSKFDLAADACPFNR